MTFYNSLHSKFLETCLNGLLDFFRLNNSLISYVKGKGITLRDQKPP